MDDYKTRLKMLPVCSCGYVFTKGVIIHEDINEMDGMKYAKYFIEPPNCPKCKKKIECIDYSDPTISKPVEYENREETAHWEWYEHAYDWNLGGFVCSNCRAKNDNLPGMNDWGVKDPYLYVGSKFCPECGRRMVRK